MSSLELVRVVSEDIETLQEMDQMLNEFEQNNREQQQMRFPIPEESFIFKKTPVQFDADEEEKE